MSISPIPTARTTRIEPTSAKKQKLPDLEAFKKLVHEVFAKHGRHLSLGRIVAAEPGSAPYFRVETNAVYDRSALFVMTTLIKNAMQRHPTLKGVAFALVASTSVIAQNPPVMIGLKSSSC